MAEIKDTKLMRDALGSPVPQYWDETSQMYIASTVDGSVVDVDFSNVKLLRDKLGSPIPQKWDPETARFVPSGPSTEGGGVSGVQSVNGQTGIVEGLALQSDLNVATAQLAEKASKTELANVLNGSPKGNFATLSALQTAFPTGTEGVYLVIADGRIYSWNGTTWADLGVYQAVGIGDSTVTPAKLNVPGRQALYVGGNPIDFRFAENTVIIPTYGGVVIDGKVYAYLSSPLTLQITTPNSRNVLVVNISTNTWSIKAAVATEFMLSKNEVVVAAFWSALGNQVTMAGHYKVNGKYPENVYPMSAVYGVYAGTKNINFNTVANTVEIPQYARVLSANVVYGEVTTGGGISLPVNQSNIHAILVDKKTNQWRVLTSPYWNTITADDIAVATYWAGNVAMVGEYTVNGKTPLAAGSVTFTNLASDALLAGFTEASHRLLLAPKMFFAKGLELPIYKNGILSVTNQPLMNAMTTSLNYLLSDGTPKYKTFAEEIEVLGESLPSVFDIAMKPNITSDFYTRTITKVLADPSAKTAETPKHLMIGDSLTNRFLPKYTKDKLVSLGITPTMVGTMPNLGGEKGEGRESWTWAHYIGRDTTLGTVAPNKIQPQPSGTSSTVNQNPFLRLSTADDHASHPDWCFRNSPNGSFNEKSYAEDTDKTGDFYIFDYAFYVDNHLGGVYPDIVTIALGTNDINKAPSSYNITGLQSCRLGLNVMLHQIKAASPTVKIGVIPSPAWGESFSWGVKVAEWIDACINDVNAFALTDVNVIPVWAHMNKSFSFPVTTVAVGTGGERKNIKSDVIHFGTAGQKQYANAIASYIVNQI